VRPRSVAVAFRRQAGDRRAVVPPLAARQEAPLVAAQQHELHGGGGARGSRIRGAPPAGAAGELLDQGRALAGPGQERGALRLGVPARAARSGAPRLSDQSASRAAHRGSPPDGGSEARREDLAVNLLEEQKFPADEPNPPYDDVAWTWPLLYGVAGEPVADKKVFAAAMEPVTADVKPQGAVEGAGEVFLLRDTGQTALLEARVLLGTNQVDAAEAAFTAGGISYPPGSWIVQAPRQAVEEVAGRTGLVFTAAAALPDVRRHLLDLPRLAVLHTWTDTQDTGWVRYTFDRGKIPYTLINDDDLKQGGLAGRFDVILFPETGGDSFTDLVRGIDPKFSPLAYTHT